MVNMVDRDISAKLATGIPGLDEILNGGLQPGRVYLVEGTPGTGKTTLSLQFLLTGIANGQSGLYITLSESGAELAATAVSHSWSLDGLDVFELVSEEGLDPDQEQSVLHPSELELGETIRAVMAQVDACRPARVVFDSLSEMRLLAQNSLRYRRQVLALKQFFTQRDCTVLLLDDRTSEHGDLQLHSIAHGVILLEQILLDYGAERRRLRVMKLRGTAFRGGWHDYTIEHGGLVTYPRLVASEHHREFQEAAVDSGSAGLNALLGGGLVRGTNTLLMGPSGAGKTSTAISAVVAALRRGERAAYFLFDEGLPTLLTRSANLGLDVRPHIASGLLTVRQIDPAEMSPGQFAVLVKHAVEGHGCAVVVIDSLNAYLQSMPGENYLLLQMHELLSYLNQCGSITLMVLGQHGLIGDVRSHIDLSYLADSVVLVRFFEVDGVVRKAISVLKTRTMEHEPTIREFTLTANGLTVGEPLHGFQGVLTGTPGWTGSNTELMSLPFATAGKRNRHDPP
ncbi:MAG: ATPase domain-containing protein [Acetobacteraceae bacterium]